MPECLLDCDMSALDLCPRHCDTSTCPTIEQCDNGAPAESCLFPKEVLDSAFESSSCEPSFCSAFRDDDDRQKCFEHVDSADIPPAPTNLQEICTSDNVTDCSQHCRNSVFCFAEWKPGCDDYAACDASNFFYVPDNSTDSFLIEYYDADAHSAYFADQCQFIKQGVEAPYSGQLNTSLNTTTFITFGQVLPANGVFCANLDWQFLNWEGIS